jgi:pimeloyl-ACP methyl ester carboxylesterase
VAIKHPERVASMALVDGSLTTRVFSYHQSLLLMALPILGRRMYDGLRGQPQAAYDSLRLFYASLDNLPEADRQFLYQRVNQRIWDDRQRDAFLSTLRQLVWSLPLRRRHFAACLASLAIPTHIIWGEQDAINPLQTARALAGILPGAKLTVIPHVGHLPQQEDPDAFLQAVDE